jgi:hypothetical protein
MQLRVLLGLALALGPAQSVADEPEEDLKGRRVRVEFRPGPGVPRETRKVSDGCGRGCRRLEGRVIEVLDDGSLRLRVEDRWTLLLPEPSLVLVEVSRGQRPGAGARSGARRGFIVGAAVGALAGLAVASRTCDPPPCLDAGGLAGSGAAAFGVVGGALGAVSGLAPRERWEVVRGHGVAKTSGLSVGPANGGLGIVVGWAF